MSRIAAARAADVCREFGRGVIIQGVPDRRCAYAPEEPSVLLCQTTGLSIDRAASICLSTHLARSTKILDEDEVASADILLFVEDPPPVGCNGKAP